MNKSPMAQTAYEVISVGLVLLGMVGLMNDYTITQGIGLLISSLVFALLSK